MVCGIRDVWVIDCTPARNCYRRDVVGQAREAADHTFETGLRKTVMLINTTTNGASPRGVAGIDVDDLHAIQPRFVADFVFEIVKCPTMQGGSLRLANRYPVADTLQVFEGDAASSALSLDHNAFADAMVGIIGEALLLVSLSLQQAFGRERPLLLQLAAQAAVAMAHAVDMASLMDLSIAVHRDIDNASVHARKFSDFRWRGFLNLAGCQQIEIAVVEPQVALALLVREQVALSLPTRIRQFLPPAQHPDRDGLIFLPIGQNAAVVGDRAVFL